MRTITIKEKEKLLILVLGNCSGNDYAFLFSENFDYALQRKSTSLIEIDLTDSSTKTKKKE